MQAVQSKAPPASQPICWCGQKNLAPFSSEYVVCKGCGTLVTKVGLTAEEIVVQDDPLSFYGKEYWLGHQVKDLGNPDIFQRARADLPERCLFWLRGLLRYKLPPGRVLEIGCAHGGFVGMLRSVGFDGVGMEMSPWVVDFAHRTFDIPMLQGRIEDQNLPEQSFDAIVLNDVVEHLVDPLDTLSCCARLLRPDGVIVVQMPSYPDGISYEQLCARKDRFIQHMDGKAQQHLNLFSPRAARLLFDRLGFSALDFMPPIFDYDMYLVTSRKALKQYTPEEQTAALIATPGGRLGQAMIEMAAWHEVCEADRAARLKVIQALGGDSFPHLLRLLPRAFVRSLKRLVRAA